MPWFFSRKRFLALEEGLEKCQRDLRATVLEAENLYEKTRSALGRIVKRTGSLASVEETGAEVSGPTGVPLHLQHLDPVSQKIHMQRAMRFNRNGGGK